MTSLVAIKLPIYNSENTIMDSIDSLLNQTFSDFKLYIYDNCSTDNTQKLIQTFEDERIIYVKHLKNFGWNYNFDYCLNDTGEQYTLIAHGDDIYHPNFIEYNLHFLRKSSNNVFFSQGISFKSLKPNIINFDLEKASFKSFNYTTLFESICFNGNFLYCPTLFAKTKVLVEGIGSFNGKEFGGSADLDAWLRLSKNYTINLILTPGLFYHRITESQLSTLERNIPKSFFVKCMLSYLDLESKSYQTLKDYISWHKYFHEVFYNFKLKRDFNLKLIAIKIFSLKVKISKRLKLLLFTILIYISKYMPKKIYKVYCKLIQSIVR